MPYELKDGQGNLWPNKDEKRTDKSPNVRGKLKINGVEYELAGWTKTTDAGVKWISISAKVPERRQGSARPSQQAEQQRAAFEDDQIPF